MEPKELAFTLDPDKISVAGYNALEAFVAEAHDSTPTTDMARLLAWFVCGEDGEPFEPMEGPDGELLPGRRAMARIGRLKTSQLTAAFDVLKEEFTRAKQLPPAAPGS